MLTNPKEIKAISKARQKNVRDPNRSREHFYRIFEDFFQNINFEGGIYIDLGAGQFDFCEIIRSKGGECIGVDNDPCVVELGRYKNFETIQCDIKKLPQQLIKRKFDGVFNKFTLNAFWFWNNDGKHFQLVNNIIKLLKVEGWVWIAPWNGIPKKYNLNFDEIQRVLIYQKELFLSHGFQAIELSGKQSKYYGIHGNIANNIVFIKNLKWKGERWLSVSL